MTKTRWLSIALFASVALNLALIGFLASRTISWSEAGRGGDRFVERLTRHMPAEAASRVRSVMAAQRPVMTRHLQEVRSARDEVRTALDAEPFDRARLEQSFTRLRRANDSVQDAIHQGVLAVAGDLGAEERRRLARMLDRGPPGHPPRDRGEGR
jgi:uncharacterized membrane protein